MSKPAADFLRVVAVVVVAYLAICCGVYRFAHPRMTETELFLHIPDAVCWRMR